MNLQQQRDATLPALSGLLFAGSFAGLQQALLGVDCRLLEKGSVSRLAAATLLLILISGSLGPAVGLPPKEERMIPATWLWLVSHASDRYRTICAAALTCCPLTMAA